MRSAVPAAVLVLLALDAHARSIGPRAPLTEGSLFTEGKPHASPNRKFRFLVRTRGDDPLGAMVDATGTVLWSIELSAHEHSNAYLVSDDGQFVAAFDDRPAAKAVEILTRYGAQAELSLSDLLSRRELRKLTGNLRPHAQPWQKKARFDLTRMELILELTLAGSSVIRKVNLMTGQITGIPDQTVGALFAELKTTPERTHVLLDLAENHPEHPDVIALWRSLVFDAQGADDRVLALKNLEARLTDEELLRLVEPLSTGKDPVAHEALAVALKRKLKGALPAVLAALPANATLKPDQRRGLFEAALQLSDHRDDVVTLALAAPELSIRQSALTGLARLSPARARPLALARLGSTEEPLRTAAQQILIDSLSARALEQQASYDELVELSRDEKSAVARSGKLLYLLAGIAFDKNRFDDALSLHGLGLRTSDPQALASHLGQLAFLEATRGHADVCAALSAKVAKLPKAKEGCEVGWRPARGSSDPCKSAPPASLAAQLGQICGPERAKVSFVPHGSRLDLLVELDGANDRAANGSVELQWIHKGEQIERTQCDLRAFQKTRMGRVGECTPRLPDVRSSPDWPLRADVRITVHPQGAKAPRSYTLRATTFLAR